MNHITWWDFILHVCKLFFLDDVPSFHRQVLHYVGEKTYILNYSILIMVSSRFYGIILRAPESTRSHNTNTGKRPVVALSDPSTPVVLGSSRAYLFLTYTDVSIISHSWSWTSSCSTALNLEDCMQWPSAIMPSHSQEDQGLQVDPWMMALGLSTFVRKSTLCF